MNTTLLAWLLMTPAVWLLPARWMLLVRWWMTGALLLLASAGLVGVTFRLLQWGLR